MDELSMKLNQHFAGKVVRKDLTQKLKQGANVPIYVLEYLLGMYCATDDEDSINAGVERVKNILADKKAVSPEKVVLKSSTREAVMDLLSSLPTREKEIIVFRASVDFYQVYR